MTIRKPDAATRTNILDIAASQPRLTDACYIIQAVIGQDDGGVAGALFMSPWGVLWPGLPIGLRRTALSQYLNAELGEGYQMPELPGPVREKLVVLTAQLAFALPKDADPSEALDLANLMLIPQQRGEGGDSGLIDYHFVDEPVISPTPVHEAENGFDAPISFPLEALAQLRNQGYAVIVWTPDELGDANPRTVEDRSIELGHEVIRDLQTIADSGCRFVIETRTLSGWDCCDYVETDGERTIATYPSRAEALKELNTMFEGMDAENMDYNADDYRIVPE